MSLNVRPHAWWIPIGLFAVMGPSRKEKRGPPRFLATRREKTCSRSQNCSVVRAAVTKSSGPGAVNMLASPCVVYRPTRVSGDAFRDSTPLPRNETAARNPDGREIRERGQTDRQLRQLSLPMADGLIRTMNRP